MLFERPPFQPGHTLRSRSALEESLINGIRAIIELHDFDPQSRTEIAIAEINLRSHLGFEVLLDLRELLMECAWRLSDLAPPATKNSELTPGSETMEDS